MCGLPAQSGRGNSTDEQQEGEREKGLRWDVDIGRAFGLEEKPLNADDDDRTLASPSLGCRALSQAITFERRGVMKGERQEVRLEVGSIYTSIVEPTAGPLLGG